jgi:membrane-bound lytic murein transglycosylase D|tara:strand:- start:12467 stop:13876 length:1410 start_codon:yes stop_codon:yes gene_type:complete
MKFILLISLFFVSNLSIGQIEKNTSSLWDEIRQRSELPYDPSRSEIQKSTLRYDSNQYVVNRLSKNGQRYLYYTYLKALERNLPVELSLIPFVESQFDPYAQSSTGASGIWQFIASTGRENGLKKNWWYDARRDIVASTDAAYNFLEKLYAEHNDWLLAIAAYNAGPSRVRKEVKKNRSKGLPADFWSLNLPKETKAYVPKILAIVELIRNPERFDIELPYLANRPYFDVVDLPSQVDLMQVANISGLKLEVIYELNPGFNQWATDPNGPFRILLPVGIADRFKIVLSDIDPSELVQWDKYLVQQGDTLTSISSKYMIDYELLKEINDLDENLIYENEELIVPRGPSWIKDYLNRPDVYYVSAGDSMWSIAKNFNVTIRDLSIWNDLNPSNYLLTGTKILIYPKYLKPKRIIKTNKTDIAYPIKKGDTISKIAIKFGIDKDWIIKWNAIENEALIYPGEIIKLNLSELN